MKRKFVVAITGASGATYAIRLLEILLAAGCDVHLLISGAAQTVLKEELDLAVDLDQFKPSMLMLDVGSFPKDKKLANDRDLPGLLKESNDVLPVVSSEPGEIHYHHHGDFQAAIASGSFFTDGMIVCPCSCGTLGAIANGMSNNLIHRAAGVHLKECRKVILVVRETPLSLVDLRNLTRAAEAGATILPAAPAFYQGVESVNDLVSYIVGKVCDQLDVRHSLFHRWGTEKPS